LSGRLEPIGEAIGNVVLDNRPIFETFRPPRLQERDHEVIRIASGRDWLAIIIPHDLTGAHQWLWDADNRTPPGFRLKAIGCLFFGLLPSCSKDQIHLAYLVGSRPRDAGNPSGKTDDAAIGKRPQKSPASVFRKLKRFHRTCVASTTQVRSHWSTSRTYQKHEPVAISRAHARGMSKL